MATIAEQLTSLANTKTAIKEAIVAKGVAVADTDTFASYATKIGEIQSGGGGEVVDKTKFGVSIDNLLGNVDADGTYIAPTEPFVLDLSGVKSVKADAFPNAFVASPVSRVVANDIISVGDRAFKNSFADNPNGLVVNFDGLEQIEARDAFYTAFASAKKSLTASFAKLKKVSGVSVFREAFRGKKIIPDETFPALEEVGGADAFTQFGQFVGGDVITFGKVKKVVGSSASYNGTFLCYQMVIWQFPSAIDFSGYIFYSSGAKEIHFAAANQAAIEACDGYANKWGATNADIIFDL